MNLKEKLHHKNLKVDGQSLRCFYFFLFHTVNGAVEQLHHIISYSVGGGFYISLRKCLDLIKCFSRNNNVLKVRLVGLGPMSSAGFLERPFEETKIK